MPIRPRTLALLVAASLAASLCAQAWHPPPTRLPEPYVQWVAKLLETGAIEDPRRGQYRQAIVKLGDATNDPSREFQTVGWVMPGDRRAVLLDGLSYPVVRALGPGDLDRARCDESLLTFSTGDWVTDPRATLPVLLLLAGDTRRAEREFGDLPANCLKLVCRQLWSRLVTRWTMQLGQAWIDRDDMHALRAAEGLVAAWRARESQPELFVGESDGPVDSALASQILADCQRRVYRPAPPFDLRSIEGLPAEQRIARLIVGLEDVRSRVVLINGQGDDRGRSDCAGDSGRRADGLAGPATGHRVGRAHDPGRALASGALWDANASHGADGRARGPGTDPRARKSRVAVTTVAR